MLRAAALALCAAGALAIPEGPHLLVHRANDTEASPMVAACDVRGRFEDVLVSFGECTAAAPAGRDALDLGPVNASEYYVVLEYQPSPVDAPKEQWAKDVVATGPAEMRVLHLTADSTRFVVAFPRTLTQQLPSGMPLSTEYLMLSDKKMRSLVTHPALQAKLSAAQSAVNITAAADPAIERAISFITGARLQTELAMLTRTWNTRNSFSPEAETAALVIENHFVRCGFQVSREIARPDMSPNVIATLQGTEEPDRWVVIGGHYDSRGVDNQSPTEPSPGANDDGTGTAALMQIAQAIFDSGIRFRYSLMLGAFTGEEQGLFGSRAKAQQQAAEGKDILAMFALDMLAYRRREPNGEFVPPQVGLPVRNHDHVLSLFTGLMFNRYVPAVTVCTTTACCSDNTAYHESGYSSTFIFESCPGLDDPDLHTPQDDMGGPGSARSCPECMDMEEEFPLLTKGAAATAFEILEPSTAE